MTFISYRCLSKTLPPTLGLIKDRFSFSGIKTPAVFTVQLFCWF